MPLLALDIGTNSTLWLIAEVEEGRLKLIERGIVGNRLGAEKLADGSLPRELIARNREILLEIVAHAHNVGCVAMKGVGTQALRSTPNRSDFIAMAQEVGLPVEVISGKREAQLAWRGVFDEVAVNGTVGLLDIGGGSSELSVGDANGPKWSESLAIGAVTLTSQFKSDPPTMIEVENATKAVRGELTSWRDKLPAEAPLIGVAGTVTAIASLEERLPSYIPGVIEGYKLELATIERWRDRLLQLTLEERRVLPGMPPVRAEFIPAGAIILAEMVRVLDHQSISVSEKGVMFGLALEMGNSGC